jgi:hypothetical protein
MNMQNRITELEFIVARLERIVSDGLKNKNTFARDAQQALMDLNRWRRIRESAEKIHNDFKKTGMEYMQ